MTFTMTEAGKVLTETQDMITMPADYSFATVNDFVRCIDVSFEDLQCLCLGLASEMELLRRGECICKKCGLRQASKKAQAEF